MRKGHDLICHHSPDANGSDVLDDNSGELCDEELSRNPPSAPTRGNRHVAPVGINGVIDELERATSGIEPSIILAITAVSHE